MKLSIEKYVEILTKLKKDYNMARDINAILRKNDTSVRDWFDGYALLGSNEDYLFYLLELVMNDKHNLTSYVCYEKIF